MGGGARRGGRELAAGLCFVLPYACLWAVFMIWPIVYGFFISLHKWQPVLGSEWVGIRNYAELWRTPRFWSAALTTGKFAALVIPLILGIGLAFALLLHRRKLRGLTVVESALFFPYLLNVSIVSIVWLFLFDPDVGIVNHYLRRLGLSPPTFLNDPFWVIPAIALTTAWWLAGYRMVVFRAALQAIPEELFESAALDGAGPGRRLLHVTLPLLKPAMLFAAVITLVGGLRTFGQVILMTGGGPGLSSEVLALYMYRLAFQFLNFGLAAAVGFILFGTIFVLSLVLFLALGFESELK
jgi:ABC-type sugar transport system permease subunit